MPLCRQVGECEYIDLTRYDPPRQPTKSYFEKISTIFESLSNSWSFNIRKGFNLLQQRVLIYCNKLYETPAGHCLADCRVGLLDQSSDHLNHQQIWSMVHTHGPWKAYRSMLVQVK